MEVTTTQAAIMVNRSERTVQRWIKDKILPARQVGKNYLVNVADLEAHMGKNAEIDTLLARIEALEARVSALEEQRYPQVTHHARMTANLPPAGSSLPEGLTPWRDYCEMKGYAASTVKRAIDRGEIPVHRGKWKKGKVYILAAVDEEGKAAIDKLYGHQ